MAISNITNYDHDSVLTKYTGGEGTTVSVNMTGAGTALLVARAQGYSRTCYFVYSSSASDVTFEKIAGQDLTIDKSNLSNVTISFPNKKYGVFKFFGVVNSWS